MSEWPPEPAAGGGSELPAGLARAVEQVRALAPEYGRWLREGADSDGPGSASPWSQRDDELVSRLAAVDPWWMRSVADELDTAHHRLRDIGAGLARIADSAIGPAAGARCAQLAATGHERATEAAALASGARTAADRADDLLDEVTRRLIELVDGGSSCRSGSGSGRVGRDSGRLFDGYQAVLHAVRAELSAAIERLPTLVGIHPGDRAAGWASEPGSGPRLPGTDAHRVETDVGVRIARLTDGPAG
ncbi:MAG TPA: hypothetical protein VL595_12275 [Pseudonocardia sp.]|jgi:hypothetical protein|nr:hypothetical protein [Pseudonocardia sp.]